MKTLIACLTILIVAVFVGCAAPEPVRNMKPVAKSGRTMKFEYGKSPNGKDWYWHLRAKNGEIIAQGEGYEGKADVTHVIDLIQSVSSVPVINLTP